MFNQLIRLLLSFTDQHFYVAAGACSLLAAMDFCCVSHWNRVLRDSKWCDQVLFRLFYSVNKRQFETVSLSLFFSNILLSSAGK